MNYKVLFIAKETDMLYFLNKKTNWLLIHRLIMKITCREIGQNLDLSYSSLRAGTKEADGSIENCNIQADEVCTQQGIFACNITANSVEIEVPIV